MRMQNQVCLMPARCVRCGEVFDMSHDFGSCDAEYLTEEDSKLLCWDCRAKSKK